MLLYPTYYKYIEVGEGNVTPLSMFIQEPTYLFDVIEFILRRKIYSKEVKTVEELVAEYGEKFKSYYPEYNFWYDRYTSVKDKSLSEEQRLEIKMDIDVMMRNINRFEHRDILTPIVRDLSTFAEEDISKFISKNMTINNYNMNGTVFKFPGSFDMIFDSLKVTDACRMIIYHDNVRGKVLSKVSNIFDEMTYEQAMEYKKKDKLTKVNRLIVMPFWNVEAGTMAFCYITEKIVIGQSHPNIEFRFEDLRGVQGENIRNEFVKCVTQKPNILSVSFERIAFNITDVEAKLRGVSPIYLKALATKLSMGNSIYSNLIHAEGYMGSDNTKIISIDLSTLDVRSVMTFTAKEEIVIKCKRGLSDIFSLVGVMVGMKDTPVKLFGVEFTWEPEYKTPVKKTTDKLTTMKILDKTVSPNIIREAIFFDPRFNKVCNKTDGDIEWARTEEEAAERFGEMNYEVFPSENDVQRLASKYEFPDYLEERVFIKKVYEFTEGGKKVEKILGPRIIPREDKDESYSDNNYAFVLGYYPCAGASEKKKDKKDKDIEYLMDETKIEIPDGRGAHVQTGVFEDLLPKGSDIIIRKGVLESRYGFILAAARAAGFDIKLNDLIERFTKDVFENLGTYYTLCRPQFNNSTQEEFKESFEFDINNFIDSKYYINAVSRYIGVNTVVFTYDAPKMDFQPYVSYEFPAGSTTDNPIDKLNLSRDYENRTVILLRRKFKSLPDQYDYLAARKPSGADEGLFNTRSAIEFLKRRITLASIRPDSVMNRLDIIPEYGMFQTNSIIKYFVVNTKGVIVGGVFERDGVQYPILSTISRAPVIGGAQIKLLSEMLLSPRPSLKTLFEVEPFRSIKINSLGVTKFVNKKYVTSVYYVYQGVGYYVLCKPHKLKTLPKYPLIETPDPYINNVFRDDRKELSLFIKDACIMKMLTSLLMQVMRIEILEGRDVKITLVPQGDDFTENSKLVLLKEIYSLKGMIPENPMKELASVGSVLKQFFTNGGLAAYSNEMFRRLQAQLNIMKITLPTMNLYPYRKNLYSMYDVYDDLFSLSVTSDTICLIGQEQFDIWAAKAMSKTLFGTLQHSISPDMLNDSSKIICVYGSRERGLWVLKKGESGTKISISDTSPDNLPYSTFVKERKLNITSNSDVTKYAEMRRML